jgi:16S rRNA (guanine(966)-N(2))-methyltransferase RsmD
MLGCVRIIAGAYRSRSLEAPAGLGTRPTSDRLRETLFNVLAPRIEGAAFLDLYAGSGAVGIEALSRGAAQVTFVERGPKALATLRGNLERLGIGPGFRVQAGSVAAFLRAKPAEAVDVVFLDPPWDAETEYEATLSTLGGAACFPRSPNARDPHPTDEDLSVGTPTRGHPHRPADARDPGQPHPVPDLLAEGAVVIAEHRRKERLEDRYGRLVRTRLLEQGDAALSFYASVPAIPS